jgi:hypothetical protein
MSYTSSPFDAHTSIQIRLIRNKDKKQDDKIAIEYVESDESYLVYYLDANVVSKTYQTLSLSGEALDTYLKSLFTLLAHDMDPFDKVQFNIPAMPCLLYDPEDLLQDDIVESLMAVMPITNGATY